MQRRMKIGIMSREGFQKYTMDIASGKMKPHANAPKIWFESVESRAQVLSTRTLKNMERYGIVELRKESGSIKPHVCVDRFSALFGL